MPGLRYKTKGDEMMESAPKLIRRNGIYYIEYENDRIQIEEWEAMAVMQDHALVYDVIVSYRRKFGFNASQDHIDFV